MENTNVNVTATEIVECKVESGRIVPIDSVVETDTLSNAVARAKSDFNKRLETKNFSDGSGSYEVMEITDKDGNKKEIASKEAISYTRLVHLVNAVEDVTNYTKAYGLYKLRELKLYKDYGVDTFKEYVAMEFPQLDGKTCQTYANIAQYFLTAVYKKDANGNDTEEVEKVTTVSNLPEYPLNHFNNLLGMVRSKEFGLAFLEKKVATGELKSQMTQSEIKAFVKKYTTPIDTTDGNENGNKEGNKDGNKDGNKGAKAFEPLKATGDEIITELERHAYEILDIVKAVGNRENLEIDENTEKALNCLEKTCVAYLKKEIIIADLETPNSGEEETTEA